MAPHERRSIGKVTTNNFQFPEEEEEIEYIEPRPWWHVALPALIAGVAIGYGIGHWQNSGNEYIGSHEYRKCVSEYMAKLDPKTMSSEWQRENMFLISDRVCSVHKGAGDDSGESGGQGME